MSNQINTIIVLRNDSTTDWARSTYKLLPGEVGVGYMERSMEDGTTKQVPIIKVGDGEHAWTELPQAEGVFENDQILTYSFGRHAVDANIGYINAGGAGMTTSEWLLDALSVTEEPTITKPTASMSASFTPSSGETGTAITKVNWNGSFTDGTYEFGSVETKDVTDATAKKKANAAVSWVVKFGDTQIGTTEDGSYAQSLVMGDDAVNVTLSATATLNTTNIRTPVNNVGAETTGKITTFQNGSTTMTFSPKASVTGYRKMFVGTPADASALDSATIRAFTLKNAQASTSAFEVTAPIGATSLVVACPTDSQGKNYTLSKAEMFTMSYEDYTSMFETKDQVQVADARGGANGLQAYNIYVYSFAALKAATKFRITLKSANA